MEEFNWGAFLVQALAFWVVYKLGQISMMTKIGKDIMKEMEKKGLSFERDEEGNLSIRKETTPLKIERVDSQYFAYTTAGQFMAQGTDFRGLFESIKSRYPNQNFKIEKYQSDLSEEEAGRMIKSIFEVFGDKEQKDGERR